MKSQFTGVYVPEGRAKLPAGRLCFVDERVLIAYGWHLAHLYFSFSQCLTPAEMLLQMAKQASCCVGAVLWLSADLSELAVERASGPL